MEHTEGSSRRKNTQEESGVDAQNLNRLIVIVGMHRIFEHQPHFHGQCARDHDLRRSQQRQSRKIMDNNKKANTVDEKEAK